MRTIVVLIALSALVFVGGVTAQSAGHGVAVAIPEVLRLRVEPDSSRLEVFASSRWQLSASYSPTGDGGSAESAPLAWSLGDGWNTFRSWEAVVAEGAPTCGWRPVDVAYGVSTRAADGIGRGVIVFTLARP